MKNTFRSYAAASTVFAGTGCPGTPDRHRPAAPRPGQPAHRTGHRTDYAQIGHTHNRSSHRHRRPNPSRVAEMTRKITDITCMSGRLRPACGLAASGELRGRSCGDCRAQAPEHAPVPWVMARRGPWQRRDARAGDLLHTGKARPDSGTQAPPASPLVSSPHRWPGCWQVPLRGRSGHRYSIRNIRVTWWSYGDSNPGPLACHERPATPPASGNRLTARSEAPLHADWEQLRDVRGRCDLPNSSQLIRRSSMSPDHLRPIDSLAHAMPEQPQPVSPASPRPPAAGARRQHSVPLRHGSA